MKFFHNERVACGDVSDALSQVAFASGHSLVSVDIFSKHHDQEFLNQFDCVFSFTQTSRSWCVNLRVRGAWRRRRGKRRGNMYCVDFVDAFRLLLSREKKNKRFVWRDCVLFPNNVGVRWAQVSESRDGVAAQKQRTFPRRVSHVSNASREKISRERLFWADQPLCWTRNDSNMPCFSVDKVRQVDESDESQNVWLSKFRLGKIIQTTQAM